jgi:hypothetical protein
MGILTSKQVWRRNPEPEGKQLGNRITPTERANVRAALEYLRGRYETTDACCIALGITRDALQKARSPRRAQTYRVACLVARAAGVPVEKILSGTWPGDRCPHCGGTGKASQIVALAGRPKLF